MEKCRVITLINYHIPMAAGIRDTDIQYITMGFFDGMLTQKINLENQSSNYKKLWEYELLRTAESKGEYSYQNIICFECDKKDKFTDEELWNEETDKEYPLTFLTFLQLERYIIGKDGLDKQCSKFNNKIGENIDNCKYYTYKTVDKNDFVVCIKCRSYKKAVEAIKQLHQIDNCNIIYSYTVFSVSKKVLNSFDNKKYSDIYDERIDSICLKGIANSSYKEENITLDRKYREFGQKLLDRIYVNDNKSNKKDARIYDILGADDFRLIARNVSLGKILCEFGRGGLLNYHEDGFSSYLFSSSLLLNTLEKNKLKAIKSLKKENYNTPLCDALEEKMKWVLSVIREMRNMRGGQELFWDTIAAMCSGIWQLLQSLKALERPRTKKYDFITIFVPLRQMIFILEDKVKNNEKEIILENRARIFDFLHKISMTLHGTLRTDIQFFQIRDFNAVIHYSPAKLRAFYSLWALQLSDYYSLFCKEKEGKTYSFILSPGMFPEVGVKQLFDNDEDKHRLMLITLPERQLYTVQRLSIMLGHEVSHFVGTDVKCREARYICLLKVITRILTLEMNSFRYGEIDNEYKEEIERSIANSKLYERLIELLLKENVLLNEKCPRMIYHSEKTILHIMYLFASFFNKYLEMITGEDCEYYYQSYKQLHIEIKDGNEDKVDEIKEAKKQSYEKEEEIQIIIEKYMMKLRSFSETILNEVLREACADVSSILTLELTPQEYIDSFCNSGVLDEKQENVENILTEKEIRISLVISNIQKEIKDHKKSFINDTFFEAWEMFCIDGFIESNADNKEMEILGYKIFLCLEIQKDKNASISHYKSAYNKYKECFTAEVRDFYNDNVVWDEMSQYIVCCIREYLENFLETSGEFFQKKEFLVNTYKNLVKKSVGAHIQTIENFLAFCEQDFFESEKKGSSRKGV